MCISPCVLGKVSEEGLSGKQDDVCSSAAELGHRKMEKERKRVGGRDDKRKREKKKSDKIHWVVSGQVVLCKPPPVWLTPFSIHSVFKTWEREGSRLVTAKLTAWSQNLFITSPTLTFLTLWGVLAAPVRGFAWKTLTFFFYSSKKMAARAAGLPFRSHEKSGGNCRQINMTWRLFIRSCPV